MVGVLRELVMQFATAALWITFATPSGWTQTSSILVQPEHVDRLTVDTTKAERATRGVRVPGMVMIHRGGGRCPARHSPRAGLHLQRHSLEKRTIAFHSTYQKTHQFTRLRFHQTKGPLSLHGHM